MGQADQQLLLHVLCVLIAHSTDALQMPSAPDSAAGGTRQLLVAVAATAVPCSMLTSSFSLQVLRAAGVWPALFHAVPVAPPPFALVSDAI